MRKSILIHLFSFLLINNINGQIFDPPQKTNGYFITNNDDTVKVIFSVTSEGLLQREIKYFDSNGQKHWARPDSTKEISWISGGERTRMLSRENTLKLGKGDNFQPAKERLFLKLLHDGKIQLFNYVLNGKGDCMYDSKTGGILEGYTYSDDYFILQVNNGNLIDVRKMDFRTEMVEYLSNCSELVKKIENKHYRKSDIGKLLIEYYKSDCSK